MAKEEDASRSQTPSVPNQSSTSTGNTPQGASTSGNSGTPSQSHSTPAATGSSASAAGAQSSGTQNSKRRRGLGVVTPNACTECRKKRAKVRPNSTPIIFPLYDHLSTCLVGYMTTSPPVRVSPLQIGVAELKTDSPLTVRRPAALRALQSPKRHRMCLRNPGPPVQGEPSLRDRIPADPTAV
jgi:hypothetical protein